MVYISRPLGRNAFGEKHDIAAIQAALKNIKIRNKPIWPGRIDGRKTKDLEEAIAIFQMTHRIKVTGKVEPRGPTITAMTRALPRNLANMRGLKGTCVVFVPTMGAREAEQEARNTQSKAPFPDKETRGLATIIKKAGRELGICFGRKRDFVTPQGRFATELAPMGLKWIDPSSGRVATLNNPPREAIATMLRVIPSSPEWQPGPAGKLECHSKLLVPALNGVGRPTAADYEALGLPQKTENEVWGPFIAAAARLVGDTTPQGVRKFDDLVQLASQINTGLGGALRSAHITPRRKPKAWPTDHRVITDRFATPRPGGRPHDGVDIRALKGENVYSIFDGEVIEVGHAARSGNFLKIRYADTTIGGYAHTNPSVKVGDKVIAGQPVGTSDGSGGIRGVKPHLHYTYRKAGSSSNGPKDNPELTHLAGFPFQIKKSPTTSPAPVK